MADITTINASDRVSDSRAVINTNFANLNAALGSGSVGPGTANELAYFNTTTSIASLAVATYPSLTEVSYVKGVTSAIQTQLDGKQATLTGLTASVTELNYTDGVTSAIQTQLDGKQAVLTGLTSSVAELNILDGATLDVTELNYVDGVTSAIQTQLNAKSPSTSPTFATSITGSYLTASEILITDGSKNIVSAPVATYPSLTELTYVKGVTSAIQTQINTKANSSGSLTQFVGNTAWRVFYSDGSGDIIELALGADGTFLKSNGASAAPTFATPAGSGDVSKVGTPVNNQIGVWTGDGTIEGDASLTWDGTSFNIATAKNFQIAGGTVLADSAGTLTLSGIDALDATTEATIEAAIDTLANLTSIQGRTVTLADAGANAIFGWDDVAGAYENLTQAEVLAVIGDSTATAKGVVELATDAETVTGTDTARATTPANITARLAAPGAIGGTTPAAGTFTTLVAGSTTSLLLGTAGSAVGNIGFRNATSGTITLAPVTGALGTVTLTLPAITDTLVTLTATQSLSNKTITSASLSGTQLLAEGASIGLDPVASADGAYSGITITATAGYTQAFGDLVYLDPTDSRWEAVDANAASGADGDARGILGMVVVAGTDGNACTILLNGVIRADANFPALTVNAPVYASETAGDIVVTQPTTADVVIRVIGFALTADSIYFNPAPNFTTHI